MHAEPHACVICQPSSGFLIPYVVCQRHLQVNENLALRAASPPCPGFDTVTTTTQHGVTDGGARRWRCPGPEKKAAESAWFGCVLVTATRQSKCGKLEQNTDLNAVRGV